MRGAFLAAVFAVACASTPATASVKCPGPSSIPPPVVRKAVSDEPYEPLRGFDRALSLGVGHLRPAREEDRENWLERAFIPFSALAGTAPKVWLSGGWLVPAAGGDPERIGSRGGLETGYETVSLIVLDRNAEGWLRVRFAPGAGDLATGWLNPCDLEWARPRLVYETWELFFASSGLSPLYFRTGGPRALRRAPDANAQLIAWIPAQAAKYALEPLEIRGDWMRARLKTPSDYCAEPDVKPAIQEGWVRWRDVQLGPLLWHYTRGC